MIISYDKRTSEFVFFFFFFMIMLITKRKKMLNGQRYRVLRR